MSPPEPLIRDLLPVLRQCCSGSYGIALGGSYAKHRADSHSDLDLYVFASAVLPAQQRSLLIRDALGCVEASSWGADDAFVQGNTDFSYQGARIECWFRSIEHVDAALELCLQGHVQREYVAWTVMGFFNHVLLSDLHSMLTLEDPDHLIARWKAAVGIYPDPLRQTRLRRFLREAQFWPENPHYRSAVARADLIYTSGIVQQVLHALIQVVFALNRKYFPGEKNLAATMATLPVQPQEFAPRLDAILSAQAETAEQLRAQQRTLNALVVETQQLVRVHGGTAS
jgi:hypothetical protein